MHVTAEDSSTSLREGDFDLALDLNDGQTPGLAITPLIEETIFPVCSPSLLRGRPPLRRPEDLAWYPLLHDVTAWRGSRDYGEWEHYLEAIEAPSVNVHRGYTFNRNHLTMEAAIAGMGVAIARQTLITNELETGALIAPLERRVATGMHYGIVYAAGAWTTVAYGPCTTGSWRKPEDPANSLAGELYRRKMRTMIAFDTPRHEKTDVQHTP
nr:LysR substrate-binding domain-containing protein [Halomonas elongata]